MTAFGIAKGIGVVARLGDGRGIVRCEDLQLGVDPETWRSPTLNPFLAMGPAAWEEVVGRLGEVDAATLAEVELLLPVEVADYVDFYSSIHHATNLGRLFRPDAEPLLPNWTRLPVGYHGRAGTVVVTGTPVRRPAGLVAGPGGAGAVERRLSAALDIELEVGVVIGVGSEGEPIEPDDADKHVFGVVLVNDWSARDIQAFEYQPLGPFLGKSFCTSMSAWVVPLVALRSSLVEPPVQDPAPDPVLRASRPWGLDLALSVELNGVEISATSFRHQWWTFAQQLAHLTSNGSTTRTGDLLASGTVSGPDRRREAGSLIELTWRGAEPLELPDGSTRTFLEDGDTVVLRGRASNGVELGEVTGLVLGPDTLTGSG